MLDYKFDPKSQYLLACSYGPDSMGLLDMMQKDGVRPIVCFVNYHKVQQSDKDEESLRLYCAEKKLVFESLDTSKDLPEDKKFHEGQNYKEWARVVRYSFFHSMMEKYRAAALLVAHQQDDLIETYLLQKKQKKSQIAHYGWNMIGNIDGMIVVRPLLNFTKQDLLEYDKENHVPYSIEMSRFEDKYTRDSIRHGVIDKLNEVDRENILEEMRAANDEARSFLKGLNNMIDGHEELNIREIIALDQNEFAEAIIKYVSTAPVRINLTSNQISDIRKMALAPQPNMSIRLAPNVYLIKEYDVLTIGSNIDELSYCYTLDHPGKMSNEHFDLDFTKGAEDRNIKTEDYPITIRTALPGDSYLAHGYLQPVRRLYIDWKMPSSIRCIWPIFLNKDGRIVYIPRPHRSEVEKHKSILKLKIKEEAKK